MKNVKLIIEYDGTNYCGWQKQKNNITVQGTLEKALNKATNERVDAIGSSRTDAGVHARGMVCNFITSSSIPAERFREAINRHLPSDVAIIKSEEVEESFHARYSSKGKSYSYTIINRYENVVIGKNFCCQVRENLDIDSMKMACKYFVGQHDFQAFQSKGSSVKTTIRTIDELCIEKEKDTIKIHVTADGFLYNMVRIIVGTLIQVGKGKIKADYVGNIIESLDRMKAGPCIKANGLVLEKVYY
ncbi:tRNA pseudouridine(38-40) synthase TruA [Clostridium vincentii]|uniref:tRNA pseudouridine synthase A n=1 Tax=Clostridium vincentii TaxID=52704 RepID=A0A2T0BIC0_9CLOT|nr:tRNA pseudouridine(38-40) synthase TruA [Clostridium vincentii]PRR83552.1 tRNA pseudouridine synthase A [Clostridium vincentii]